MERSSDATNDPAAGFNALEERYVWTYTSPVFPMAQVRFYIPRLRFLWFYLFCAVCGNIANILSIWDAILTY